MRPNTREQQDTSAFTKIVFFWCKKTDNKKKKGAKKRTDKEFLFIVCLSSYTRRRPVLSKALVSYCFLVFRRVGEYISLDLFYFVDLTSSCSPFSRYRGASCHFRYISDHITLNCTAIGLYCGMLPPYTGIVFIWLCPIHVRPYAFVVPCFLCVRSQNLSGCVPSMYDHRLLLCPVSSVYDHRIYLAVSHLCKAIGFC